MAALAADGQDVLGSLRDSVHAGSRVTVQPSQRRGRASVLDADKGELARARRVSFALGPSTVIGDMGVRGGSQTL